MKRFWMLVLALAALGLIVPAAVAQPECTDAIGCVEVGPDDPIVIGAMVPLSGPNAILGDDQIGAIEIAVEERMELLGREIELVAEDSACNAEGGQAAAQRLAADDSLLGAVGTSCSGAAAAALPIISEAGMVMISPSNTSPALTTAEGDGLYLPGYFRTAHNDLFQGRLAAQFARQVLEAETLATIHDGDPYTEGLQAAMADAFIELGGEVVFQGAVTKGDTDMTAILTEVAAAGPDVLYFPVFEPESNFLAAQGAELPGLEDTIFMTADGSLADSFPENTGDAAAGMYMSGPFISGEEYEGFLASWDEFVGGVPPSGFHAHAYDATNILLDAIEAVAVEGEDGTLSIGRQALRDQIASLTEYDGLTGTLTCQTEEPFIGDCATGEALAIFEITEAELDGAWPPAVIWTPADAMEEEME